MSPVQVNMSGHNTKVSRVFLMPSHWLDLLRHGDQQTDVKQLQLVFSELSASRCQATSPHYTWLLHPVCLTQHDLIHTEEITLAATVEGFLPRLDEPNKCLTVRVPVITALLGQHLGTCQHNQGTVTADGGDELWENLTCCLRWMFPPRRRVLNWFCCGFSFSLCCLELVWRLKSTFSQVGTLLFSW